MKKLTIFLIAILSSAALAQAPKVMMKHVAVVETEVDAESGVADAVSRADVREITKEIRSEAMNNLPRSRYTVMTSETVLSMGSAVLEECAEENCVIALGTKIGADYIVRGSISKLRNDMFTLSVEMYDTEYGALVASISPVRTEKFEELFEKSRAACAAMYKRFLAEAGQQATLQQGVTTPATLPQAQPKAKAESYQDFTRDERLATWVLNVVPGLGSGTIMKDSFGWKVNAVLGGLGMVAVGTGVFVGLSNGGDVDVLLYISGLGLWVGAGSIWNTYRSITYKKPNPNQSAGTPSQNFNIAVLPDANGNLKAYALYSMEF